MEAAQCSVKKILSSQSGGIVLAMPILLIILAGIGYFMSVSDNVDKEIRHLTNIKNLAFLKSDLQNTTRRTLLGTNADCPAATMKELQKKFVDFQTSSAEAVYELKIDSNLKSTTVSKCFFHPNRYQGLNLKGLAIEMGRASEPDFLLNSSSVVMNIRISTNSGGKNFQQKYFVRYKISVRTMDDFVLVSESNDGLFDLSGDARVFINGKTLIDQEDRTKNFLLDKILGQDVKKIWFGGEVHIASPALSVGTASKTLLTSNSFSKIFTAGTILNALPEKSPAPYQIKKSEWEDVFDYSVMDKYYPLPQLTSQKSVVATNASSVIHEFGSNFNPLTFHSNTKQIFNSIYGDGKKLFESCNASNIDGGQFNLIIFNNINQDFTIDFSENNSSSSPPSFCGLIAARNIKIILNDEEKGPHREHLFIGKLLVKGSIHISRNGNLRIHDIATVNSDSIKDIRPEISLENLKFQFYNQKYFSAQNFTVPFFKDNSIYNSTAVQHMGYVPRSTRSFFNQVCDMPAPNPHFRCRQKEITSPDMKTLTRDLGKKLIYDISILE